MNRGVVISLCDRTGNMVRPWVEAGYRAMTFDLQDADPQPGRAHFVGDVCSIQQETLPSDIAIIFAFPPCTNLAVSGARWFKDKGLSGLIDALSVVEACRSICENSGAPWMLENPVSTISTYWRKPDYSFDPYQYARYAPDPAADAYTKRTCLWTGGRFVMPDRKPLEPSLGSMMHRLSPSDDRANIRSVTPLGFAYAVFAANSHSCSSFDKSNQARRSLRSEQKFLAGARCV